MNILDSTNEFVNKAIQNHTFGNEGVDYAVGLGIVPDANGQPAMVTTLVLRMSSIIVNQSHTIGFFVNTPVPSEEEIDVSISKALIDLRKMRDADLNVNTPGAAQIGRSLLT